MNQEEETKKTYTIEELEKIKIGSKEWRNVNLAYKYAPIHLSFEDKVAHQIWIGIRFAGKTWGTSNEIIKHFKKTGKKTLMLFETLNEIQDSVDLTSFAAGHEEDYYEDIEGTKTTVYQKKLVDSTIDEKTGLFIDTYEKKEIITVAALSKAERLKPKSWKEYDIVWQDEIFKDTYLKNASFKLTDVFSTTQRTNENWKFIGTGNAISINAPIFRALNINSISKNIVTTFYDEDKKPFVRVFNWVPPFDLLEERYGHLASFKLAKRNGYFKYAFKNIMKGDTLGNIEVIKTKDKKKLYLLYTFKMEDKLIDMFSISKEFTKDKRQRFYFSENKNIKSKPNIALKKEYVDDNLMLNLDITMKIAEWLQKDLLVYENVMIKQMIWEIAKKFF